MRWPGATHLPEHPVQHSPYLLPVGSEARVFLPHLKIEDTFPPPLRSVG